LRIYTGNRLEALARKLADVLEKPLSSPLDTEIIVVQSKGMERWLSMRLAEQHGICANCSFKFPNTFINDIFSFVLPDVPEKSPFEPGILAWKLMEILPGYLDQEEFGELKNYLAVDDSGIKQYQLCRNLADLFDQYTIFRPDMIHAWEEGRCYLGGEMEPFEHWQKELWTGLTVDTAGMHRARLKAELLKQVCVTHKKVLPQRISVFGISYLPRFHLEILHAVSDFTDVNLFLMNPCREYWGDIRAESEIARVTLVAETLDESQLHLEEGNPLLASMGLHGRHFFDLIQDFESEEYDIFQEVEENTILAAVQNDILNLNPVSSIEKRLVDPEDRSIQIHSCHSPMRELEVLYDNLLAMFEADSSLRPEDIVVMAPDIDAYGPFIQAIFGVSSKDTVSIPYSIADRLFRQENELARSLLKILDLSDGRLKAPAVLDVLESASIRSRFNIAPEELSRIHSWVEDTRIRWGIDAGSRQKLGLPGFDENSWEIGLSRLLLGYALPGDGRNLYAGILPFDDMEGAETVLLGNFIEFVTQLFAYVRVFAEKRTLEHWADTLHEIIERFFDPDEVSQQQSQLLGSAIRDLAVIQDKSGFERLISFDVVKAYLKGRLDISLEGRGFISSGVTFCAMLPMRSIPFKIVCLLGINHDAFPRQHMSRRFDLIARKPRRGDRSRRDDDLYLFLEALLSARNILYISYLGQSMQDNSQIPPSVVLSSLLDYAEQAFSLPQGMDLRESLVTKHYLQAFNPRYFLPADEMFSYSGENAGAAASLVREPGAHEEFFTATLPDPGDEWRRIDVDQLQRFFRSPVEYFCKNRLGMWIADDAAIMIEREPFDIAGLEKYSMLQDLVRMKLEGSEEDIVYDLMKASGQVPYGEVGSSAYRELVKTVDTFALRLKRYLPERVMQSRQIDLEIGDFRLTGTLAVTQTGGMVAYRPAKLKAWDFLDLWIGHLVLNAQDGCAAQSFYIGKEKDFAFSPQACARDLLAELLQLYWQGLAQRLPFFPRTSFEYAEAVLKKHKERQEALESARLKWMGNAFEKGEADNSFYRICLGDAEPLDDEFERVSLKVFEPLLEALREVK